MQQAITTTEESGDAVEAHDAGEVIDAFDHVIAALDEVYDALAQFSQPVITQGARRMVRMPAAPRRLRAAIG